jgi:hypothetical protein
LIGDVLRSIHPLSVSNEEENAQNILCINDHRQWASPMFTINVNQAILYIKALKCEVRVHTYSARGKCVILSLTFQTGVMPGQQISKVDRRKIDSKFLCSKCELLLNEPMQTQCGHLMCKSCVQVILR